MPDFEVGPVGPADHADGLDSCPLKGQITNLHGRHVLAKSPAYLSESGCMPGYPAVRAASLRGGTLNWSGLASGWRMAFSTKLSAVFLVISILWTGMTNLLCPDLFPQTSLSVVNFLRDLLFGVLAALAIKTALSAEERRQKDKERMLADCALRDPLTGLLNRRAFDSHLAAAVERAKRSDSRLSVAFIDLDGFKRANDRFGHAFGDAVLRAVAERLRQLLRSADIVARLGGDEFGFIIESDNDGGIEKLVERLFAAFRRPLNVESVAYPVSLSIGIARFPDHCHEADCLLRAADAAMYREKAKRLPRSVSVEQCPEETGFVAQGLMTGVPT